MNYSPCEDARVFLKRFSTNVIGWYIITLLFHFQKNMLRNIGHLQSKYILYNLWQVQPFTGDPMQYVTLPAKSHSSSFTSKGEKALHCLYVLYHS